MTQVQTEIFCVKLSREINETLIEKLTRYVSPVRKKRVSHYVRKKDVIHSLVGEVLTRTVISSKLNVNNTMINFSTNEYGKPFLVDNSNLHFNVSHSGNWVVVAICDDEVGIDIEQITQRNCLSIAKSFFSYNEFLEMVYMDEKSRQVYFTAMWALKESYLKARGIGLSVSLDTFDIRIDSKNGVIFSGKSKKEPFFSLIDIDRNYKMALCTFKKIKPKVIILNIDEFLDFMYIMERTDKVSSVNKMLRNTIS